jgi:hypothetical protein
VPHCEFGTENAIHTTERQGILNHGTESGARGTLRLQTQERKSAQENQKQISGGGAHIQLLKDLLENQNTLHQTLFELYKIRESSQRPTALPRPQQ